MAGLFLSDALLYETLRERRRLRVRPTAERKATITLGTADKSVYDKSEKPKGLSRSEWTVMTLSVHHANFTPEDNRLENLISLCTPCLHCTVGREDGQTPHLDS
ncbi:hypothetical protein CK516_24850 [Nostoc sp. 'Peltigera malacea cyanobiont' DB3992]|nr:hypothetical protein CK516_24850 [Nostoc sp. 'Peltigera malacea cyanobiont' DB3992]